jgi:Fe2+ transport system protein FeoA
MRGHSLPLAVLSPGESGTVIDVLGSGGFRRRLLDMGFVRGAPVRVIKTAPLMNPIEYCVGGTHVTLRRKEAMHVVVEPRESCLPRDGDTCTSDGSGPGRGERKHLGWRKHLRKRAHGSPGGHKGPRRGRPWWKRSSSE